MLFYSDSATDKEIIHLSDAMNMEKKNCFPKKYDVEKAFTILMYFEKKYFIIW